MSYRKPTTIMCKNPYCDKVILDYSIPKYCKACAHMKRMSYNEGYNKAKYKFKNQNQNQNQNG